MRDAAADVGRRAVERDADAGHRSSHTSLDWVLEPLARPLPALCFSIAFQALGPCTVVGVNSAVAAGASVAAVAVDVVWRAANAAASIAP